MKKLILAFMLLSAMAATALAEDHSPLASGLSLGYMPAYFHYEEPSVGMQEDGMLNGGYVAYTHHFKSGLMLSAEAEVFGGSLNYSGGTWGGSGLDTTTDDWLVNGRVTAGWDFKADKWVITPYAGVACRYWYDKIHTSAGYRREITYLYSPVGAQAGLPINDKWTIGFKAEYGLFWQGWVKSRLSDANSALSDVDNRQEFGSGHGARASAWAGYDLGVVSLMLEPFVRYWNVGESNSDDLVQNGAVTGSVVEPRNWTLMLGARLGVYF